ncbi:MAG: helix-turn-helix domain containing protein [Opitutaceae bacterium]|nr:helix-turn-helix domain containing protein [Opitutaceae bacterium]
MERKHRFVSLAATGRFTFTELCADFHVSRKTGHKWWKRYRREGTEGLRERSRRPQGCSHQTAGQIQGLIVRLRRRHRTWGAEEAAQIVAPRPRHPAAAGMQHHSSDPAASRFECPASRSFLKTGVDLVRAGATVD